MRRWIGRERDRERRGGNSHSHGGMRWKKMTKAEMKDGPAGESSTHTRTHTLLSSGVYIFTHELCCIE